MFGSTNRAVIRLAAPRQTTGTPRPDLNSKRLVGLRRAWWLCPMYDSEAKRGRHAPTSRIWSCTEDGAGED